MSDKSLRQIQSDVDQYISQYKEGYFHPMTLLARFAEEVGELAREVNHMYGQKPKKRDESEGSIAHELADILFTVVCMANSLDIDLEKEFHSVMKKVKTRDKDRWTKL